MRSPSEAGLGAHPGTAPGPRLSPAAATWPAQTTPACLRPRGLGIMPPAAFQAGRPRGQCQDAP